MRQQRADDLLDVLVAHHANHERRTFRVPAVQIRGKRPSAFGVVGRVEQDDGAVIELNSSSRAGHCALATPCSIASRDIRTRWCDRLEQTHGDDGVVRPDVRREARA